MAAPGLPRPCRCEGVVTGNEPLGPGLLRLSVRLPLEPGFVPGQFAMLNLPAGRAWTFGRPLSILDWLAGEVSFLYRVVGRGTGELAGLKPGAAVTFLGPLGTPFPLDLGGRKAVLVAGGVGLPPLFAWRKQRPQDVAAAYFGARDQEDAPWPLLDSGWRVGLEDLGPSARGGARQGLVTDLLEEDFPADGTRDDCTVLACGPWPMLEAVHRQARRRGWPCWLSLEEHMGCGYGACKGCVVPVADGPDAWRPATCCQDGPVFDAAHLAWPQLERT